MNFWGAHTQTIAPSKGPQMLCPALMGLVISSACPPIPSGAHSRWGSRAGEVGDWRLRSSLVFTFADVTLMVLQETGRMENEANWINSSSQLIFMWSWQSQALIGKVKSCIFFFPFFFELSSEDFSSHKTYNDAWWGFWILPPPSHRFLLPTSQCYDLTYADGTRAIHIWDLEPGRFGSLCLTGGEA